MTILRSLRAKMITLVVGIALLSTTLAMWAARLNAEQAIWEQVNADAELVGAIIAESIALSREVPDQMEEFLELDMVSTAQVLAKYVALAERSRVPREELLKVFQELTESMDMAEIWITDSAGKVVYSAPKDIPFTFSPDPKVQPQASAFWPLLTGEAKTVAQPTRPRDIDGQPFKYVGVSGVDRPRIVQIGVPQIDVLAVRERLSVRRLSDLLLSQGVLKRPLLVVDKQMQPVADLAIHESNSANQGADGAASAAGARALTSEQASGLAEALNQGRSVYRMEADVALIYRPYRTSDGRYQGAYMAGFQREGMDRLVERQSAVALKVGAAVMLVSSLLGWLVSHGLTARLTRITTVARSIQGGDFGPIDRLKVDLSRRDEVALLGQVVHTMGLEVRNREAILEGQVQQRTRELAARNEALASAQATIRGELELAKQLQLGILPAAFPVREGWQGAARIRMQQQMGGDFYDFIERPDGSVAVVMADVSGKGLAAAFFMAMTRTGLLHHLSQGADAAQSLARVNDELCRANPLDLFVTVFVAVLDPRTGQFTHANAGHNPPLLFSADGAVRTVTSPGELALGVMPGLAYSMASGQLAPGDCLLAYTDGVTEAFDTQGQPYGEQRLLAWAAGKALACSAEQRVAGLFEDVEAFQGKADQSDDITVAAISRRP